MDRLARHPSLPSRTGFPRPVQSQRSFQQCGMARQSATIQPILSSREVGWCMAGAKRGDRGAPHAFFPVRGDGAFRGHVMPGRFLRRERRAREFSTSGMVGGSFATLSSGGVNTAEIPMPNTCDTQSCVLSPDTKATTATPFMFRALFSLTIASKACEASAWNVSTTLSATSWAVTGPQPPHRAATQTALHRIPVGRRDKTFVTVPRPQGPRAAHATRATRCPPACRHSTERPMQNSLCPRPSPPPLTPPPGNLRPNSLFAEKVEAFGSR